MTKGILGTKVGMTQVWKGDKVVPVTVVLAGPCQIVQRKTAATDGYNAIQVGYGEQKESRLNKPALGHLKKNGASAVRYLREFRDFNFDGDVLKADLFEQGEIVDVTGTSKGRGTQGVMRRWGFKGGPASHGSKKWHRRPGSIGQRKTPGRVYKGKRMAGHWGVERITVQNLEIIEVRPDENLILVKGGIPGPNGGLVILKAAAKGGKS
ncbi:50S ribosomal protein L3 [Deinococcus cellulosilyticus]|uniref:Large ribosomal subunit protein uL3 n=2 Tax=Deinococcus TaxID=1298 RepID=A0A511N829_DEIC1|nr:50S ribosomal protein L3 [Deinococcus cellulosilyticus]GEM48636.1 50S ribosomal protein L3 [Deinococcus cellulosilyticus NBRC 106333 = KACC 11606]